MENLLENLQQFTELKGPSGREAEIAQAIRKKWQQFGEVVEDGLGNLSITLGKGEPHIAFVAHMDEVGFVIRRIGEDGFISLNRLGGIPERVLAGQKILLLGRKGPVKGVFTTWPHHLCPAFVVVARLARVSEEWAVAIRDAPFLVDFAGSDRGDAAASQAAPLAAAAVAREVRVAKDSVTLSAPWLARALPAGARIQN